MAVVKQPPSKPDATRPGDWAYAQVQYECTARSTYDIAADIGFSQTAVMDRAQRYGWVRNKLPLAVQQAATLIANEKLKVEKDNQARLQVIERVNVEMQAKVLVAHRADIAQARKLCMRLFKELEDLMDFSDDLATLGELLRSEDDRGRDKLNDAYKRVLSMPERTATLRALGESLKTLIALQRQAFGITGVLEDADQPVQDAQAAVQGMDAILAKFATVLQRTASAVAPRQMGEVVDAAAP